MGFAASNKGLKVEVVASYPLHHEILWCTNTDIELNYWQESKEQERLKQQRLAEYAAKKSASMFRVFK